SRIVIEYDPADVDRFIAVADLLEDTFPAIVVEGNEEGAEGRQGSFEVRSEGQLVFSRLSELRLPDPDLILERVTSRMTVPAGPAPQGPGCG
ncbi:hypothetical protein V8C86DRAFT_1786597, partial [Haematococcus lacustris]